MSRNSLQSNIVAGSVPQDLRCNLDRVSVAGASTTKHGTPEVLTRQVSNRSATSDTPCPVLPQLGRVGVFGGSKDYTGAPFFASMSSLRTGADLAYVMTAEEAAPALKAYSPELMVRRKSTTVILYGGCI